MTKLFKIQSNNQLNCFSPPVMIASFVIELVLALYTLLRYKMNPIGRLAVVMLLALACFQLCEYHVCRGYGIRASEWSRAGFAAITLLPALGLHALHIIAVKTRRRLIVATYTVMTGFIGYFLLVPSVFDGFACTGNYVIFQIGLYPALLYAAYYYGSLVIAIMLGYVWARRFVVQGQKFQARAVAVQALIIGYLVFLVPTAIANTVKPSTRSGIPSIMCGFAVIFAIILTCFIMPRIGKPRKTPKP